MSSYAHDKELGLPTSPNDHPLDIPSLCGIPLKHISLVTLAIQNSALTLIMHYSRVSTPPSRAYSAATAVLLNEILKGLISLVIAYARIDTPGHSSPHSPDEPQSAGSRWVPVALFKARKLSLDIFSPDCWKLSIPAILYVIQNNLQYVAVSNLDAATFQVTYQMKILTTAAFSVLLLRRKMLSSQWLALLFLAIGVGIVQIQAGTAKITLAGTSTLEVYTMNGLKGFLAVVAACFTSGLAGVYFEMVLKNSQADLWVRNVQLSLFSLLPALGPVFFSHASSIRPGAGWVSVMFRNFGAWAWATVAVQVLGGLVTAMVIKYSDNILKGFATSLSIVISFLASIVLFDFEMTFTFILGSVIVLMATWLYNQPPGRSILLSTESTFWSSVRNGKSRNHSNSNMSRSHSPISLNVDSLVSSTRNLLSPSITPSPHSPRSEIRHLEEK